MIISIHKITIHGKKVKAKEIDLNKIDKIANTGASLIFRSKNGRKTEVEYIDSFVGCFGLRKLEDYSWNQNAESYELNGMEKWFWIDNENSDKVFKYAKDNNIHIWYYEYGKFIYEL